MVREIEHSALSTFVRRWARADARADGRRACCSSLRRQLKLPQTLLAGSNFHAVYLGFALVYAVMWGLGFCQKNTTVTAARTNLLHLP